MRLSTFFLIFFLNHHELWRKVCSIFKYFRGAANPISVCVRRFYPGDNESYEPTKTTSKDEEYVADITAIWQSYRRWRRGEDIEDPRMQQDGGKAS